MTPPARGRRIVILCEGDTEVIAARNFLKPQLDRDGFKPVGLQPINLKAKFGDIADKTIRSRQESDVAAVFTLVDLYGFPGPEYPKSATVAKTHEIAKAWLTGQVPSVDTDFFHPHFAVHDIEAWLLAEGTTLGKRLRKKLPSNPRAETIDFDQPPGKRVNKLFLEHLDIPYPKKLSAPALFKGLEFDTVYKNCPYFKAFYDDLKEVAAQALTT